MRRWVFGCLLFAVVVGTAGAGIAVEYDIRIDGSYDTPAETVTVEGDEFVVTAVSAIEPGDELTVHVTAPADEEYQINLYNVDEQVQDFHVGTGNETVTFETGILDPGSYVVAAVDNGEFYAVHPVVLRDYEIDVTVPERVGAETSFDATVTLDPITGETTTGEVELIVWSESTRERYTMDRVDDGTYETTVTGLANGSYDVYANVIAAETIDGEENAVGLSEPVTISVDEAVDPTPTPTPTPADTPGTPTPSPTPTDTPTPEDGGVITPGGTPTPDTVDDDGAGFGPLLAVAGLSGLLLVGLRVSRRHRTTR